MKTVLRKTEGMTTVNDREKTTLTHLVNVLGETIQRFDDAAVTRDVDPPVDGMRDAAHELHYYLTTLLTRPGAL